MRISTNLIRCIAAFLIIYNYSSLSAHIFNYCRVSERVDRISFDLLIMLFMALWRGNVNV
jgi:hypothetical protein